MALIQWNDSLKVNVAEIDKQHQKLVDMINSLHEAMRQGQGNSVLGPLVSGLIDYTATHFASEEKLMEAAGYPMLDEHRKLHRHLLSQARDMEMRAEFGEQYVPVELSHFLYNWLIDHIQANDKKFGEFMAARSGA